MRKVQRLFDGLVHRAERGEVDHHGGVRVFGNRFGSGGVDRNQGLIGAPVQLGVVVAVKRKHLQRGGDSGERKD